MKVMFVQAHTVRPRNVRQARGVHGFAQTSMAFVQRSRSAEAEVPADAYNSIHEHNADIPNSSQFVRRIKASFTTKDFFIDALENEQPDIVQAEGLDVLLFAWMYTRRHDDAKLVYQVSDVREVLLKEHGLKYQLTNAVEKFLLKRTDFMVVTSRRFFDDRYKRYIPKERCVLWENAPDLRAFNDFKPADHQGFNVGFVGSIRYQEQLRMLVDATEGTGMTAIFSGMGKKAEFAALEQYCDGKAWTSLTGAFDFDTEVADVYSQLDCVYAVYDADNANVRVALPNKLYEAAVCGLPLIVAKGTYLAQLVEEWGTGIAVDCHDTAELREALVRLRDDEQLRRRIADNCVAACERMKMANPASEYRALALNCPK